MSPLDGPKIVAAPKEAVMPDTHAPQQLEPWQWTEAHWRKLVEQVRAGRSLPAQGLEGRRALRGRALLRLRPRDQRAARRRQVDRPAVLGPVRAPRRRAAHPQAAGAARRPGDLLRAGGDRAAASGRAARADRRRPRDRHPWLDPRAQFGAAARGRARPDAALRRHAGEDHRRAPGRHAHPVVGLQPQHAGHREGDGPALRLLADGRRGLLRAAAATASRPAWSSCRSNGSATTRSISR